jgi:CubicO group peptidase (beta-lactamase class C family)
VAALPDAFARYFAEATANGACDTVAVGLIRGKAQEAWTFNAGRKSAPADSNAALFEVGSVTDIFTGLLLAQAAIDGRVRLANRLDAAMPHGFVFADAGLAARPLSALATQSSRLPPVPANLFPDDVADPYANYREADLFTLLANGRATAVAGSYSTLNGGLLGVLLARSYGSDFPGLLASRIFAPLAMTHSGFEDSAGLLAGHAFGQPAKHWHFGVLAGAAGMRSTLGDLLAFVRANLQPESSPLRGALLLARQARDEGPVGGLGLGWNVHEVEADGQTWPLVWRASETGGFSTFIGFRTDRQQGLVLLANSAAELAPVGIAWLTDQAVPTVPPPPFAPSTAQLARYPGLYRLLDGGELTVRAADGGLSAQLHGQPPWPLLPLAEDVFVARGGTPVITFVRNIDVTSGLLLNAGAGFISAERLSARAPRLARPTFEVDATRAGYTGDYVVAPDLLLRIGATGSGLTAHFTGSEAIIMQAYAHDRFTDADGTNTLSFRRSSDGKLVSVTVELAGGERNAEPVHWRSP